MDNQTELTLYFLLFLVPAAITLALFYLIRNPIYFNVNCWFCNKWSKVTYRNRNSFYCPFCQQYNGFNKNGEYNRVIEEQFDSSFNSHYICNKLAVKTKPLSNGLCTFCNHNQEMKVRLLANFVPMKEKNYDFEVEHFQAQLECFYKLCKKCDKTLTRTLNMQKMWIFENSIRNLKKNTKAPTKFILASIPSLTMNIIRYLLILILLIILCQILCSELICSDGYILPVKWIGLTLEVILFFWSGKSLIWSINELLGWLIIIFVSLNTFTDNYFVYFRLLQVTCSGIVIYSLLANKVNRNKPVFKTKTLAFKKLQRATDESECSDSDDDELSEDISNLPFSPVNNFNTYQNSIQSPVDTNILSTASIDSLSSFRYNKTNGALVGPHSLDNFSMWRANRDGGENTYINNIFNHTFSARSQSDTNFNMSRSHVQQQSTANIDSNYARSTRSLPNSLTYGSTDPAIGLDENLSNVHISNPQNNTDSSFLLPTKLQNVTSSSWTAKGLWNHKLVTSQVSTGMTNVSLSSSGFLSNNNNYKFHKVNNIRSYMRRSEEKMSVPKFTSLYTLKNFECSINQPVSVSDNFQVPKRVLIRSHLGLIKPSRFNS